MQEQQEECSDSLFSAHTAQRRILEREKEGTQGRGNREHRENRRKKMNRLLVSPRCSQFPRKDWSMLSQLPSDKHSTVQMQGRQASLLLETAALKAAVSWRLVRSCGAIPPNSWKRFSAIRKEAFQVPSHCDFPSSSLKYPTAVRKNSFLVDRAEQRAHRPFRVAGESQGEGMLGRKWSSYFSCWGFLSSNFTYSRTVQICSNGWETHCELLNLVNYKVIGKTQWKQGFAP